MATQIPLLTTIDPFPTRALPQDRFDGTVKRNMDQIELMIDELDFDFIPAVNAISTEVDTKWLQTLEKAARAVLAEANSAESEANALASEQAAALSESHAATSEANALASENAARSFKEGAEEAAQYVYVVTGIGKATSQFIGLVKPDNTTITVDDGIITAEQIRTARKLKVALGSLTDATFDGSADQEAIPVSGTLAVANGGTGQTSIANIMAGKDASGNTITDHYATKSELQAALNGAVQVVEELPAVGAQGVFYLIPLSQGSSIYHRYIWEENGWLNLGPTSLDLSEYSKKVDTIRSLNVSGNNLNFTKDDGTTGTVWTAGTGLAFNGSTLGVTSTAGTIDLAWNTEVTLGTVGGLAIKAKLPPNPNADQSALVTQNVSTANENHPILLCYTKDATTNQGALTSMFASGVKVNPSTSTITASTFNGNISAYNVLNQNDGYKTGDIPLIFQSLINTARACRTAFLPASAITIEYSTDGSTWVDYGATNEEKENLFAMQRGFNAVLGKGADGGNTAVTTNCKLRITIAPTDNRYTSADTLYLWVTTYNHDTYVNIERSTIGAKTTFTTIRSGVQIAGWSAANIISFPVGSFGGGTNQTSNYYAYRFTFYITHVGGSTTSYPAIHDIRLYGVNIWRATNDMMFTDHIYSWDRLKNAIFPAAVKANSFSVVSNSAYINLFDTDLIKGTNPSGTHWNGFFILDQTENGATTHRSAAIEGYVNNSGSTGVYIRAYDWTANSSGNSYIAVHQPKGGTGYTEAPTPADNDNTTKIATTAWVQRFCGTTKVYATLGDAQTFSGKKTFAGGVDIYSGVQGQTASLNIRSNYDANEGGQINFFAPDTGTTYNGFFIDNYKGVLRIIGLPSADGKTKTGNGTALNIDVYAKTITGGYTFTGNVTGNCSGSSGSCTGNAATASKVNGTVANQSHVTALQVGNAMLSATVTSYGGIWSANTKNYRVGCATYPGSNDNVYLCYSITNANISSTTNAIAKSLIWNADSGTLSANIFNGALTGNATTATTASSCSGNSATANRVQSDQGTGSYVNSIKLGAALASSSQTIFGAIWNAPTKNYRVACATYPTNSDQIIWYSITNANVSSSTNTVNKFLTWDAGTGIFTATGFSGPLTGNVTGNCSGSSGSCTGNAATATKATQDSDGNAINSTYLKLAGGTMTGNILASNTIFQAKATGVTRGSSTTAVYYFPFHIIDSAGKNAGGIYYEYLANKTTKTHVMCYKGTTNDNSWSSIGIGYDNSGNVFTWAPTPATADNSTKIATTAFVKAQGYITSSGTAANVSGTVAIGNGGTGATTRLNAVKALTNENVGTNAQYFLTITDNWGKAGYTTVANAKTVLGLKSAAYTESSAYATSGHNHDSTYFKKSSRGATLQSGQLEVYHTYPLVDFHRSSGDYANDTTDFTTRICECAANKIWIRAHNVDLGDGQAGGFFSPNGGITLGTDSARWGQLYTSKNPNVSSDERLKQDIMPVPEELLDAWDGVQLCLFRYIKSVQEQNSDRYHAGVIAQQIKSDLKNKNGIDAHKYGFFCYDEWEDEYIEDIDKIPAKYDKEGKLVKEGSIKTKKILKTKKGNEYSIRYEQFLIIEAAYQRRKVARLEERIAKLEKLLNVA